MAEHQFPDGVTRVDGAPADLAAADLVLYLVDHEDNDRAGSSVDVPVLDCRRALKGPTVQYL